MNIHANVLRLCAFTDVDECAATIVSPMQYKALMESANIGIPFPKRHCWPIMADGNYNDVCSICMSSPIMKEQS